MNKDIKVKKNSSITRSSWGGLEIATRATMKAMAEKEKKKKEEGNFIYAGYMLKKWSENGKLKDTMLQFDVSYIDTFWT